MYIKRLVNFAVAKWAYLLLEKLLLREIYFRRIDSAKIADHVQRTTMAGMLI